MIMPGCEVIAGTKMTDHLMTGSGMVEATRKWVAIFNAGISLQGEIGTDHELDLRTMDPRIGILMTSKGIVMTDTVDEVALTGLRLFQKY